MAPLVRSIVASRVPQRREAFTDEAEAAAVLADGAWLSTTLVKRSLEAILRPSRLRPSRGAYFNTKPQQRSGISRGTHKG
ncbi:hypothetical protein E2C01_060092 [Portunus trituberculatus]|uniref:Uncharacterized protein n=1 Tax=Portunus trituberculatus TaxID=210409 RepID=A0A5B7H4C3_PORTR|nr:hypothetical protein [Portunus trituberculatus]